MVTLVILATPISPERCWTSTCCSDSSCAGGSGSPIGSPATGWTDRAYYRGRFIDQPIDNPDQRIQHDIDVFTTGHRPANQHADDPDVPHAAVRRRQFDRVGGVVRADPVESVRAVDDSRCTVPKALFWMVLLYVFFTTVVAFWIGRPLIRLSFRNEASNAAFRYAPGPAARRRRGGRLLPRRARRAQDAREPVRVDRRQLPGVHPTRRRLSSAGTSR